MQIFIYLFITQSIPFFFFAVLLLVKATSAWRATHQGQLPQTASERSEFKDLLRSWQRSIDGCPIPEENFTEAVANAHKVWAPATLSTYLFHK